MSTISVRIPDSIHNRLRILSKEEHVSINQLIGTSLAEKLSAIDTENYLKERAQKGNLKDFHAVLAKVPSRKPCAGDDL